MSDDISEDRRRFLRTATTVAAAGLIGSGFETARAETGSRELESLSRANGWLNSSPLMAADLQGKVVLVNFGTYTCINWMRTLPYVRAWAERYRSHGLVVIGAHTPEFSFEKDIENVRPALKSMDVGWPMAVDSDYAIWNAFNNHYWPALYLLDGMGRMRYRQFGEGQYAVTDTMIRSVLADAGAGAIGSALDSVVAKGTEAQADWDNLRTGETYVGHARTEGFASPESRVLDKERTYSAPRRLRLNQWALTGPWTFGREALALGDSTGKIAFRFHARDLHLVMGPVARGGSVPFRVRLDGQQPGAARGIDIDEAGTGVASEQRMYQLIRQPGAIAERQFEIEYLAPGAQAFVFTFG